MIRFEAYWMALPLPALVLNPEDCIMDMNPAAERLFNSSARALAGVCIWDRIADDVGLRKALNKARKNEASLVINEHDLGTAGPHRLRIAPLTDQPEHMIVTLAPLDLSGRVEQGRAVKSAARSAIGMAEMLAHEIKNPLAGIAGAAQLLAMNVSSADGELTDLIVEETQRIVGLLEQVEQFGNLRPPARAAVNIHDILDRAQRSVSLGVGAHMSFRQDYDPSLPEVYGDADQLVQVILNLLKNAAEAAPSSGGLITLRSAYEHGFHLRKGDGSLHALPLQIEIEDNGPGVPADLTDHIFEPFVSGRTNGTGLGLALVSKIIAEHEGWITVTSAPGRTVFRLSLPTVPKHITKGA